MRTFVLTNSALNDLRVIAQFTESRWGKEQRNTYLAQLDLSFHRLADAPLVGASCDDVRSGYRRFPVGSHVIFYRMMDQDRIQIVRILHKSMDVPSRLRG